MVRGNKASGDKHTRAGAPETALRESEERVRKILDSILAPEGELGNLELADIINAKSMQLLMDNFYKLTGMPMGMIDVNGKVLVGVGWQDICTKFHRIHPETRKNCIESDTVLSAGVPHGEFKLYKCKNNLWDVATPIMVGGKQFGNFFMGQFFFDDESPDVECFRSQARRYGYDEKEYIAALEKVPRLNRETLATGMAYFMELADMISRLSYSNIKLARSLSERDALMESLRESEERFRSMFERHKAVMLLIEPESGAIVDANAAASDFYGHSRDELRRLKIQEINQLTPEEVAAERKRVVEEQANHLVFHHRIASGEIRWVEVYSTPIESQGNALLFSIIHDITDRKRAEDELHESELFYRQTLESIPGMVFTTRPDGFCDYQSQQWVDFTGVPMSEHVGDGWNKLLHPDDRPRALDAWLAAVEERAPYDLEYRVRRSDGAYEWFKVCGRPIRNAAGEIVRWFGTAVNIDRLLKAQEMMRQQEERLRLALAAGRMATWDWHVPSGEVVWNEMHYRMMGYEPGAVQPSYQAWADRVHPDDVKAAQAEIQRCMAEGRDYTAQFRTLWPDGTIRWLETRGEFEYDADNQPLRNYGVMIDITERKRTEEALKRAYDEMEKRVEERTAELRNKDQILLLQSRQAAMGEMISNIAHQWRQPLNALGLTIQRQLLLYDLGEFTRESLVKDVGNSMGIIQHMSKTVDDFSNYFRPDKEKIEFNLHEATVNTLSLLEGMLQTPRISVEIAAMDDPVVYGFQNEFAQVLLNIMINARDALTENKIDDPRVTITIGCEDGCAVLTVADNAGGIPEEIIGKVFDPYFTTKGPQLGTGVGLFMSKAIIEKNMGGKLTVRNSGTGAEFRIALCTGIHL